MNIVQNPWIAAAVALVFLNYSAEAGQSEPEATSNIDSSHLGEMSALDNGWNMTLSLDSSYVAGRSISFQGAKGDSDAESVNASLRAEIPLDSQWFIPAGINSRDLFLGSVTGAPIPDEIDTLGFDAGLGCRLDDQWTVTASVGPRFYRLDDVDSNDIGIAGVVRASYQWNPGVKVALGVAFEPDNEVPVLPVAGLRWDIRPDLTLNLMWPKPEVIYRVDDKLSVFVGGGGNFTVFRADQNLGDKIGQPIYDNALGTYRDFHIGTGADYRIAKNFSVGVETGYSMGRQIDYPRIDQTVDFDPSPYIKVSLKHQF